MIRVYQHKNPTFLVGKVAPKHTDFKLVAHVATESLEEAYRLTNTIVKSWWTNPGVTFHGSPEFGMDGCRSTSVGDVLEEAGRFWIVARAGFTELVDVEWLRASLLHVAPSA